MKPVPSPSINLFYPDQTMTYDYENNAGCLNDGNEPAWMAANPTVWLASTLEKWCVYLSLNLTLITFNTYSFTTLYIHMQLQDPLLVELRLLHGSRS
jgi:hypothetical protein